MRIQPRPRRKNRRQRRRQRRDGCSHSVWRGGGRRRVEGGAPAVNLEKTGIKTKGTFSLSRVFYCKPFVGFYWFFFVSITILGFLPTSSKIASFSKQTHRGLNTFPCKTPSVRRSRCRRWDRQGHRSRAQRPQRRPPCDGTSRSRSCP